MYARVRKALPELYAFTVCMWLCSRSGGTGQGALMQHEHTQDPGPFVSCAKQLNCQIPVVQHPLDFPNINFYMSQGK